jgi:diaminohydroxyphosphoribosylaminopyrimidine deaminase/5-amino-6-(5-phosphoribosylamino)uracil reductase
VNGAASGALDTQRLNEALDLAAQSVGLSDPNPRVGCIVGNAAGDVFGRGYTQEAGGAHAEVMALREAASSGADLRGATAWVTLEPCAHQGRTPPCTEALVGAGLGRVVVAVGDPFPQVAGAGITRLRAAGIQVDLAGESIAQAARELNIGFFSRFERGRPWVRLKVAVSLDGRVALADGSSQWLTGEAARRDAHAWRRRAGAIVTGVGTVIADDPRLDVRLLPTRVQPLRLVLDPQLRTPATARVLAPPGRTCLVHAADTALTDPAPWPDSVERWALPRSTQGLDLPRLLAGLAERQVNELHLEGGPRLNAAWLGQGLVDELLVYLAPCLVGPGLPLAGLPALSRLSDSPRFSPVDVQALGNDLRWRLRPQVSNELTDSSTEPGDGV